MNSGFNALGRLHSNKLSDPQEQGSTNFLQRPDANYFRLCTPYCHCCNLLDSAFIAQNQPQIIGKQMGKSASQKSLFTKIGGGPSLTFQLVFNIDDVSTLHQLSVTWFLIFLILPISQEDYHNYTYRLENILKEYLKNCI